MSAMRRMRPPQRGQASRSTSKARRIRSAHAQERGLLASGGCSSPLGALWWSVRVAAGVQSGPEARPLLGASPRNPRRCGAVGSAVGSSEGARGPLGGDGAAAPAGMGGEDPVGEHEIDAGARAQGGEPFEEFEGLEEEVAGYRRPTRS